MKTLKLTILFFAALLFSSCNKEEVTPTIEGMHSFVGTFAVAESTANGDDNYDITINQSPTDKNGIEIANFAGLLKKKVQAAVNGTVFTIPFQSFQSGTSKITVEGSGTLEGTSLKFTYKVKGDFNWDAKCVSTKK